MPKKEYGKDDWYRRTTWGSDDLEAFSKRLNRSHGQDRKAQYLRIQASYLQDEYPNEALKLLAKIREEYPEPFELSSTYLQIAECLIAIGRKEESISWFRKVLEQEEIFSSVQTEGYIEFPTFIVTDERKNLYAEAKDILLKHVERLMFPVDFYRCDMAMAIIEWDKGNLNEASDHARDAIAASQKEHSGFRYHPNVGLVKKQDKRIQKLLKKISKYNKAVKTA